MRLLSHGISQHGNEVELQKKDKERKVNNKNPELRSKRFLHKVNTIYLFLKKQTGFKYFGAV